MEEAGSVGVNMISSAHRVILYSLSRMDIPEIEAWVLIFCARGSIKRVNIIGDRGHPCLFPLVIWNLSNSMPSVRT